MDPPAIAQFLRPGNWLIPKVRLSSPDRARDAIDLVAAMVDALGRFVEHAIFGEYLFDSCAPTRRVVLTEDVVKIAGQQGRYAVGHGLSPLGLLMSAVQLLRSLGDLATLVASALQLICSGLTRAIAAGDRRGTVG